MDRQLLNLWAFLMLDKLLTASYIMRKNLFKKGIDMKKIQYKDNYIIDWENEEVSFDDGNTWEKIGAKKYESATT